MMASSSSPSDDPSTDVDEAALPQQLLAAVLAKDNAALTGLVTTLSTLPPSSLPAILSASLDSTSTSPLHWAAWTRNLTAFALLHPLYSPNLTNAKGESVLEWSIRGGDPAVLALLLTSPSVPPHPPLNVHSVNLQGGTAVMVAAEEGKAEVVCALHLLGADLFVADNEGRTALHLSARHGHVHVLTLLLSLAATASGPTPPVLRSDIHSASPIHYAALGGNGRVCQELVKGGCSAVLTQKAKFYMAPNPANPAGQSDWLFPDEIAQRMGHAQIGRYLRQCRLRAQSPLLRQFQAKPVVKKGRPSVTAPQLYFFSSLSATLLHFEWRVRPLMGTLDEPLSWVQLVMHIAAALSALAFLFIAVSDPGFVPIRLHSPAWLVTQTLNGTPMCPSCRLVKPIRSKHCAVCGRCVQRMDHHCVVEGTPVTLADGTSVPIEEVQEGAEVLSYHAALAPGETEGLTVRKVDAVLDKGHRACVELLFDDSRTLVCTPDHRIRTVDGRWVQAGDLLLKRDEVAVAGDYRKSGAPNAYRTVDEMSYGVHHNARVLPLSHVRVVGRRDVGEKHVWDLSVPSRQGEDTRSFVANGVVVHNCPWVNNCVALHNHREFIGGLLALLAAIFCYLALMTSFYTRHWATLPSSAAAEYVAVTVHCVLILLGCLTLCVFQTRMLASGLTSNEWVHRHRYDYLARMKGRSPFDEGRWRNLLSFLGLVHGRSFIRKLRAGTRHSTPAAEVEMVTPGEGSTAERERLLEE